MNEIKISENQRKVLKELAKYYRHEANCIFFDSIAEETKLEKRIVRLACRALARKGFAEYVRGLFAFGGANDGMIAGSGYCATRKGALLVNGCKTCHNEVADMIDGNCEECWKMESTQKER